jgi:PHD/YefM family antitoxin component YafN of YafNO toxin-antitoxin module
MIPSLPDLPQKWVFGEKVPFTESNVIEFKEVARFSGLFYYKSPECSGLPKYRDTIIGFLNGGQGYLFMGILNDGTIVGVSEMTDEALDKLKVWVDTTYNILVHKDGSPLDPSQTSLRVLTFPVENTSPPRHIVCIKVTHTGEPLDIMSRGGKIIYRLNASNYKIVSEPIYRKRDVQGMIQAIQSQMQEIINTQHKALKNLAEKHKDEMKAAIKEERERSESQMREVMTQVSESLYSVYRHPPKEGVIRQFFRNMFSL